VWGDPSDFWLQGWPIGADVDANFNWQPWCRRLRERSLPPVGRRSDGSEHHSLEVLHDGGEMELIARTGKSPQSHALEAVVILEVSKASRCVCVRRVT